MLEIKRYILISTLLTLLNTAYGQTLEEAYAMLGRGQLDSSFTAANSIIKRGNSVPQSYEIAGRLLYRQGNFGEAIKYLEMVNTFPNAPLFSKAWAMHDLAVSYYSRGEYGKAKENLLHSLELKATKNVMSETSNSLLRLGLDNLYNTWTTKESEHFNFHFQDSTSVGNISAYIIRKENAFDSINNFFRSNLPKKIDYFIWKDATQAQIIFKRPLAFTAPNLCLTHTGLKNTVGHEITHSISFFAARPTKKTSLISEGVCVYFDLTKRDNMKQLKTINQPKYSIIDIWTAKIRVSDDIIYPLGGELVKRLIESFGREKFIKMLSDQSYENAKEVYGANLDVLIGNLENDIRN